jgi:hypothetical protein
MEMKTRSTLINFTLLAAILAATGFALGLVTSTPGKAMEVGSPLECWDDPSTTKSTDADDNSIITFCCYDEGCWICGADLDCEWDDRYRVNPPPPTPSRKLIGGLPPVSRGGTQIGAPPTRPGGFTPVLGGVDVDPVLKVPKQPGGPGGVVIDPVHGTPPKQQGGLGGVIIDPVHGTPPKGVVGIAPVRVVGTKQPGNITPPATIFRRSGGIGRFGSNPVQVLGINRLGSGVQSVTSFARAGGHRH